MTRLGIQISSVRKYIQTPEGLLDSYRKVSSIGYRFIQNQWIGDDVPYEFIRDALAETEMTCLGTQDFTETVLPRLDDFIRMNKTWDSKNLCISGVPRENATSLEGILAFAKQLNGLTNRLHDEGLILSFHPKYEEYQELEGQKILDILLDNVSAPFEIVLDIYHAVRAGIDPAALIRKLRGRLDIVHCKDGINLSQSTHKMTPTGQGEIDWPAISVACTETNVGYCLTEQEAWEKDPFECLAESFTYLKSLGLSDR